MSKKRGFSIVELLTKFESLMTYFTNKLQECSGTNTNTPKSEKDKQDLTIFSILLLTSRLVPFSFFADEESQESQLSDHRRQVFQSIKDKLNSFIDLIRAYSASSTYFVRKISAQALLPLLKFSDFIPEIVRTLEFLTESGNKVRQNQAHGLLVRVQVFMEAYFKYREVAKPDCSSFVEEETQLVQALS